MRQFATITRASLALAIAFAGASGAADARTARKTCQVATEAQVTSLFDAFNAAWATKSPETVAAMFAPDATLLPTVSNVERTTPDGIRAYFVNFLKGSPVGTIDSSTIRIDCNTASRAGNWTVNLTDAATGNVTPVKARYTFIYKYVGGKWMISHLHSSVQPPTK